MDQAQSGYVNVPGGQLYFEVEGRGPDLTLIHAGVAHLRMWDAQVAAWKDGYRVIRYDARGFGRSRVEDVPYSNRDDLGAVLDHVGANRTHLLGISRGSMIATDFAVEDPQRVKSLVWVAGGLRGYEPQDDPRLVTVWPEMERLEEAHEWESLVELETRIWTDGPGQPTDRVDPEVRRQMVEWNLENYRADQSPNQPIMPDQPAAQRLERLTMPLLLMWGTLDEQPVLETGQMMAEKLARASSHVFEGVAHMVNLERPAEFNLLVREFLDEVEQGV